MRRERQGERERGGTPHRHFVVSHCHPTTAVATSKSMENVQDVNDHAESPSPSTRSRVSKTAEYFTKREDGNFVCKLCKEGSRSQEVIIPKEKDGCTASRWRHLKKYHAAIHDKISSVGGQHPISDMLPKGNCKKFKYMGLSDNRTKVELASFIARADCPFSLIDGWALKRLLSYFAQHDVTLPCVNTVHAAVFQIFKEGQEKLKLMLETVQRVSLTVDTWTSDNHVHVLGIAVYWIDEGWTLCERVLAVEELIGPHTSDIVVDILLKVLKDFNLLDKVCSITTDNADNDNIMVKSLGQAMKKTNARFTTDHHMHCIAHVLNLVVQEGLQQLGIEPAPTEDELVNQIIEGAKEMTTSTCSSESTLDALLGQLRKAIMAIKMSPHRITQYRDICEELGMDDSKELGVDFATRWNSTLDMLCAAISKRLVLDKMARNVSNTSTQNYLIMDKEWDLLEIFAHLLWPFRDGIEILNNSKTVFASRIMPIVDGLLQLLNNNMASLDHEAHATEPSLTPKQLASLKRAYDAMILRLTQYQDTLKRNPIYMIVTALDPQIKLTSTIPRKHRIVHDKLLLMLEDDEDVGRSTQHKVAHETTWDKEITPRRLGKIHELPNRLSIILSGSDSSSKRARATAEDEIKEYFNEACVAGDPLTWWGQIGCFRYPKLARLAKEYLFLCMTCTPSRRLLTAKRAITAYERKSLKAETLSVLMTLKCWAREEDVEDVLGGENVKIECP